MTGRLRRVVVAAAVLLTAVALPVSSVPGDPTVRFSAADDFSSSADAQSVFSTIGGLDKDLHLASSGVDLLTTYALDKVPTGSGNYLSVLGRRLPTAGDYRAKVHVTATGGVGLSLQRATTVRARVWKAGTTEPTTWQKTAADSTAGLQAVGSLGLFGYLSGSATNAPVTTSFDDLLVNPSP